MSWFSRRKAAPKAPGPGRLETGVTQVREDGKPREEADLVPIDLEGPGHLLPEVRGT